MTAPSVGVDVHLVKTPASCAGFQQVGSQDTCTQLVWNGDQVDALFALPVWDQVVAQLKALGPLPSYGPTG